MGSYEWPCPKCGTAQKVRAPNGTEVQVTLCAACSEAEKREAEEVHAADVSRTKKARGQA